MKAATPGIGAMPREADELGRSAWRRPHTGPVQRRYAISSVVAVAEESVRRIRREDWHDHPQQPEVGRNDQQQASVREKEPKAQVNTLRPPLRLSADSQMKRDRNSCAEAWHTPQNMTVNAASTGAAFVSHG